MNGVHRTVKKAFEELQDINNSPLLQELWNKEHQNEPIDRSNKEYISWKNSLPILLKRILNAGLGQLDIFLEYPSITTDGRIDALLVGWNTNGNPSMVLFELKQWEDIVPSKILGKSEVFIPEDHQKTPRNHPIFQLLGYKDDFSANTATAEKNISIYQVAFLHNFNEPDKLIEGQYKRWSKYRNELYGKNDYKKLENYLQNTLLPQPNPVLAKQLAKATYKLTSASFKDLTKALKGKKFATMVSDQRDVEQKVVPKIRKIFTDSPNKRQMIVIQGAPGTGKTIIGLQLLYDYKRLSSNYKKLRKKNMDNDCAFCLPKSRTVPSVIYKQTSLKIPYTDANFANSNKIIIVDEAHRITDIYKDLNNLYSKTNFLILLQDDRQCIMPDEKGTLNNFKDYAKNKNIEFSSYKLSIQKRSGFLDNYIKNVDKLLYGDNATPFANKDFKIGIYPSPTQMLERLKNNAKSYPNNRNKLIASFDWPWRCHDDDVSIKPFHFQKPWNPRALSDQADWYLAKGSNSVKNGEIDKIGCVYTTQGLEFDNVGFIWGKDFIWDKEHNRWKINVNELQDIKLKDKIKSNPNSIKNLNTMKNIYRVLLTRATKGLGLYFLDKDTEEHVRHFFNLYN